VATDNVRQERKLGQLLRKATELPALRRAWQRIRTNGLASRSHETREAIGAFEADVERNLSKIRKEIRAGKFLFDPQTGVLKKKSSGGKRGIVMASVRNRVVERALLDLMQTHSPFVRQVISNPHSVGGVPNRGVPHGLAIIDEAFLSGKFYFVRSDISGFFDNIPKQLVLGKIAETIPDQDFLDLLGSATTVTLSNEKALGEDRGAFPTDESGVAQGSPLSPLFGNILLYDFDVEFNKRNITCVRFIDDFVILAKTDRAARRAFTSAANTLQAMGLKCHDPFAAATSVEKASHGRIDGGFVFLGYDIRPGLFQPSKAARQNLVKTVSEHIRRGRWAIADLKKGDTDRNTRQRYVQTLVLLDRVLKGWGEAFSYTNARSTLDDLDKVIDDKITDFRHWFANETKGQDWRTKRRLGGVCLLGDIPVKSFENLPFVLDDPSPFRRSQNTLTISTDGSVAPEAKKRGKDQGPGGWAFVVHESGLEQAGFELSTTNNQMELRAVVEAIKSIKPNQSVVIETDSRYVERAFNNGDVIKSNHLLWNDLRELRNQRKIKITWVKGHSGNKHNERADILAKGQVQAAQRMLARII
jgi:ribonuclease HI/retron-type reverse transcriptase